LKNTSPKFIRKNRGGKKKKEKKKKVPCIGIYLFNFMIELSLWSGIQGIQLSSGTAPLEFPYLFVLYSILMWIHQKKINK
jgi:hypothetical protein